MDYIVAEAATHSSKCWEIIHIPEKPPVLPHLQETVDVFVSTIEPKHANSIVRKLNHIAPLEGLRHVKRIQKTCLDGAGKYQLSVILCPASGDNGESDCMPKGVVELVNAHQLSTFILKVCKHAALTKEEWEEQCKLWPTSFHPPTYNIEGITGFNEEDSFSIFNFMELAVSKAKSGVSFVNAAIIVDPSTKQVIASGQDQVLTCNAAMNKSKHPESIPKTDDVEMENDQVLQLKCSPLNDGEQSYKYVSCLNPWGWIEQQLNSSPNSCHPLQHAAMVTIEKSAARDRVLFPAAEQSRELAHVDYNDSYPTSCPSKRQKINKNATDEEQTNGSCTQWDSTRPYLCTGYDIFFVWEPCVMCAMAVVHQRIKRVFYAFPNPSNGALGSIHRLQGEKSLNHHYAVFRVMMPEDILDTKQ